MPFFRWDDKTLKGLWDFCKPCISLGVSHTAKSNSITSLVAALNTSLNWLNLLVPPITQTFLTPIKS